MRKTNFQPNSFFKGGFTLVELLAVITIIILIASFSGPALQTVLTGSNVNRAGQLIGDQIVLARQEAISRNRDVEVRFVKLTRLGVAEWSAVQVFDGSTQAAIGKLAALPDGVIITSGSTLSPLLTSDTTVAKTPPSTMTVPGQTAKPEYVGFRIRPTGGLDSSVTSDKNFVTIQQANAQGAPPSNFYTVQVNPITGKVTIFRP